VIVAIGAGAQIALDLAQELAELLPVLVVDAGDRVLLDPLPDLVDALDGALAPFGEEDKRLTAVALRGTTLDIVLSGEAPDHLGDGGRLDAERCRKVAHRLTVGLAEGLEERLLSGVQLDPRQPAAGPHAVGVGGLGQAEGHCAAMIEPHNLCV
jgi:hypothetical protein